MRNKPKTDPNEKDYTTQNYSKAQKKLEISQAKFNIWKANLLDLSKRNAQLNLKPTSKGIVEIISPKAPHFFKQLVIEQKMHRFVSVYKPPKIEKNVTKKEKETLTEEEIKEQEQKWHDQRQAHERAIKNAILKAHPLDLITTIMDKPLQKDLSKLYTKNKHNIQEKGVNIIFLTFGIIKWYEPKDKDFYLSPLLMVPIKIKRIPMSKHYTMELLDDDIETNPAFVAKCKNDFELILPEFPEEFTFDTYKEYIETISALIQAQENWNLEEKVFMGLYSFSKLSMYNDMEEHYSEMNNHHIIRAIADGSGYREDLDKILTLDMDNDDIDPLENFSVLSADASQLQAILAAEKGTSLVIRGPPGTGKSQCITNIIAECLSQDKKVLFVAQKMAALDVVKKRLDATGIGEFCLEIHSEKANKRDVLNQIANTLSVTLKKQNIPNIKYKKAQVIRDKLNDYVEQVNANYGVSQTTIVGRISELAKYDEFPTFELEIPNALQIPEEALMEIEDIFSEMDNYEEVYENYENNLWRHARFPQLHPEMANNIGQHLNSFLAALNVFTGEIEEFSMKYGTRILSSLDEIYELSNFVQRYSPESLTLDIKRIHAEFQKVFKGGATLFNSDFRKYKKQIKNVTKFWEEKVPVGHSEQILKIKENYFSEGNFTEIGDFKKDVVNLRQKADKFEDILKQYPLKGLIYSDLLTPIGRDTSYWDQLINITKDWLAIMPNFLEWTKFIQIRYKLAEFGISGIFDECLREKYLLKDLPEIFRKTFLESWIEQAIASSPLLEKFSKTRYEKQVAEFTELDNEILKINRYRLAEQLFKTRPQNQHLISGGATSEYGFLNREMMKKRNIKPLRTIFKRTKHFLTDVKPCFLMSPLSVAQYLDGNHFNQFFDIVIFDEASQVCPEDAIGAIFRGKQVVIVGDEKQLPPTRFFSSNPYETEDLVEDHVDVFDSILEECIGIGIPVLYLTNHYRSKKEGLIAFSNQNYYGENLNSFPDAQKFGEHSSEAASLENLPAIDFRHIPEGVYDKGKTRKNKIEAEAVAEAILAHYQSNKTLDKHYSLGVIAFSEAQMDAIGAALEKKYKEFPDLEQYIENQGEEPLFIKNLENVQGDERDFIFFSIGYGKDDKGKMTLNFGPLNRVGGERRLNVAITRARYHIKIFCSFLPGEVDLTRTSSAGVHDLIEYLRFSMNTVTKERPRAALLDEKLDITPDFREVIADAILNIGYTLDTGVGYSKNKIDIAIIHPKQPNRYIVGIILDSGAYSDIESARERENIRPTIFGMLGWNLYRLYTLSWVKNQNKILKEIQTMVDQLLSEEAKLLHQNGPDYVPLTEKDLGEVASGEKKLQGLQNESLYIQNDHAETETHKQIDRFNPTFREQFQKIPGVKLYIKAKIRQQRPPERFLHEKYFMSLVKIAENTVGIEGPIHIDLLEERLLSFYGVARATGQVKQKILDVINELEKRNYYIQNNFIYPKGCPDDLIRIALDPNDDPRKFAMISGFELKNCCYQLLNIAYSMDEALLQTNCVQFFGIKAMNATFKPRLTQIIQSLEEEGKLTRKDGWVSRVEE